MYKNLIYKILLLPKTFKLILIIFLDISIIIACTYLGLAIRLDEFNLFNYSDKILINVHYFLIPLISYFLFAFFFKFYSLSFRYYNLGNDLLYVFPLLGITILILNIFFNEYFSYGSIIISIILISSIIIISRKLISKIFLILQNKSKINTLIICNSKNLHKIYEYLNLNDKILIKSLVLEDQEKTDFSKYRNFRIKNIKNISEICKKYKIKLIYSDKIYKNLEKKIFKRIKINILQTDDLYKLSDLDDKQQFVDEYFKSPNKIKSKQLNYYKNKIVLITGAGGSIGKNLFFEVLNLKPKKIILAEQDELKLFNLKKEYDNIKFNYKTQININFLLGNLSNDYFLKKIFLEEKNIDCVLHASAYKHVGLGEENILSFVKNNIFVTHNLAKISILQNVKKFIFISTDKAVNPKSVMGYTKSICEKILINLNKKYNLKNFFKIVRFGNVINSDGSVLPIFEKQILSGGPLTVTNKNVSRFFMSIKNACELVLHTVEIDKNIGLFILDMGKSYKILDIAKAMIDYYLKKKKIVTKPKIVFIGLQKGEKIYEELILGKNLEKTKIKNILTANEKINGEIDYGIIVAKLKRSYIQNNDKKILYYLKKYA